MKRQKGMTLIGTVIVLALIGFFTLLILNVGPLYGDYYKVKTAITAVEKTPNLSSKSIRDIKVLFSKKININYIDSGPILKATKVKKGGGKVSMHVKYDFTAPLLSNLDVVLHLDESFEVR
jgi:Tfp pilus assembly major pilin PilA